VLRADVGGNPSFGELLGRVREADLAAYAHQDLPFERLVDDLNPARSMGRNPLFQVTLSVQGAQRERGRLWDLPELEVTPLAPASETTAARVDLSLDLNEHRDEEGAPAGMVGALLYAVDLFDEVTARGLSERLVRVLERVAADPDVRVGEIDVLGEGERSRVVERWNETAVPVVSGSLAGLFEAQVGRARDAVAVIGGDRRWSYAELDAAADRVARGLVARGVGRGDLVGV
ncbi:condensation domain-containing protein, partial [Streptomyces amakusaensis]